jgi:hypothetical protein
MTLYPTRKDLERVAPRAPSRREARAPGLNATKPTDVKPLTAGVMACLAYAPR